MDLLVNSTASQTDEAYTLLHGVQQQLQVLRMDLVDLQKYYGRSSLNANCDGVHSRCVTLCRDYYWPKDRTAGVFYHLPLKSLPSLKRVPILQLMAYALRRVSVVCMPT